MVYHNQLSKTLAYLEREPLQNIMSLKMLQAYQADMQLFYVADGVLLLLPTNVSYYDANQYPDSEYIVFLNTDSLEVTAQLLDYVPTNTNLIFKLIQASDQSILAQRFSLERVIAFESYTCQPPTEIQTYSDVVVTDCLDRRLVPLFAENGYSQAVVEKYLSAGEGVTFSIYQQDQPVAACFAFLNYEPIWEIGGLYTLPEVRRQGLGRRVVETGVRTLLDQHRSLRYQMHEANIPSKRLAEAIGLDHFLTITHYKSYL